LLHGLEIFDSGYDDEGIAAYEEIIRAGFERLVLERLRRIFPQIERDESDSAEHEGDRPRGDEFAAALGEDVFDLAYRPILVVGYGLDEQGDIARAVGIIGQLFHPGIVFQDARAALDGPLDIFFGHIDGTRLVDRQAEREVRIRIAAAMARRHDDVAAVLRENSRTLGIVDAFLTMSGSPMRVS
jgi:hypothetical protein